MANANFFSPDGGITRYPLEDTEGRTTYEEEVHGINKAVPNGNRVTLAGITYTKTSDTITANGTASGSNSFCYWSENLPWSDKPMILKGCPAGGSPDTYQLICASSNGGSTVYVSDTGNGAIVPANTTGSSLTLNVYVRIKDGATVSNLAIKPMLYDAIHGADFTYRPYNQQSIQHQINDVTGVTGVRNLLENTATTQTISGVTFTVNADKSVTVNGTATASITNFFLIQNLSLKAGTYYLSGNPAGVGDDLLTGLRIFDPAYEKVNIFFQHGRTFTLVEDMDNLQVIIRVNNAVTLTNAVFKPMIKLASDPSDEYVPSAMTNRELTEKLQIKHFEIVNMNTDDDGLLTLPSVPTNIALLPSRITVPGGLLMPCATSISGAGKLLLQFFNKNTAQFVTTSVTVNGTLNYIKL